MIGKTISHYQILKKLGHGGMGEVYLARDSKLNRNIVLKFLPQEYTRNERAKQRFIHEAQAASSLQHQNIYTIHDIDETPHGQVFICMDFYDGESLEEKIKKRPLKIEDVLDIAIQIAQGLAGAHNAGIIHRDIKPANILITEQNEVKIIDFGLAKLAGDSKFTRTGTMIGTAAFMSPEQVQGKKVDHRTDIWSLGVVMYQMLTGLLPFKGEFNQVISYAILSEEPEPVTALRTGIPMELERIVQKAMTKEPSQRYQHVDEILVDLEAAKTSSGAVPKISTFPKTTVRLTRKKIKGLLVGAFLGGVVLTTVLLKLVTSKSESTKEVIRFKEISSLKGIGTSHSISADGKHITYQAFDGKKWHLCVRNLSQLEGKTIAEYESNYIIEQEGFSPFFSPDGQWICYNFQEKLYKIAITGGTSTFLANTPESIRGGFWGTNDSITFATTKHLYRIAADGSNLRIVSKRHVGKIRYPSPLPDEKTMFCTIWHGDIESAQVGLYEPQNDSLRVLFKNGTGPCYSQSGHILYANTAGLLFAARFDAERQKVIGTSIPTSLIVYMEEVMGRPRYSLSKNGTLTYIYPNIELRTVVEVDRQGNERVLLKEPRRYLVPCYSPNRKKLLLQIDEEGEMDIWTYDIEQKKLSRIAIKKNQVIPRWTPDGQSIIFSIAIGNDYDIYRISMTSTTQIDTIIRAEGSQRLNSISSDNKWIFFSIMTENRKRDIWVLPNNKDSKAYPVIQTSFDDDFAELSPNGQWLAYHSNITGMYQVYIQSFQQPDRHSIPISISGGWAPLWSKDGKELFYRHENKMYAVPIETEPEFKAGTPKVLFEGEYQYWEVCRTYDIHPSGDRFVMITKDKGKPNRMVLVLNWLEELKRLAPVDG